MSHDQLPAGSEKAKVIGMRADTCRAAKDLKCFLKVPERFVGDS